MTEKDESNGGQRYVIAWSLLSPTAIPTYRAKNHPRCQHLFFHHDVLTISHSRATIRKLLKTAKSDRD